MNLDSCEVVIIGGGVSGLSSAYFLAKAGVKVAVVEKGAIGGEASGRNGGSMSPRADEPPIIPMAELARRLWLSFDEELGYPTEFIHEGRVQAAMKEEEMDMLTTMESNANKFGIEATFLSLPELKSLIPEISDEVVGSVFFPNAGHSNPQRAVQAYGWACQDHGGKIYQGTAVTGISLSGGKVRGVNTTSGMIPADIVVCAAGPQTSLVGDTIDLHIPVAPGRVEIIATMPLESRFKTYLSANGLYGRQTLRGNLVFGGGPHEWIDVNLTQTPPKPNTPLIRNLSRRLAELLPGFQDLRLLRSWSGIVEQTPDRMPIIDKLSQPEGLVIVTVSGNGFGLSPATGTAVKELIVDGQCSFDISPFNFNRFESIPRNWRETWNWESGTYNT